MIRPHRSIMLFAALLGALPAVHPADLQAARERPLCAVRCCCDLGSRDGAGRSDLLARLRMLKISEESVRALARRLGLGFEAAAAHAIEAALRGESTVILPPAPEPERFDWSGIAPDRPAPSREPRSQQHRTAQRGSRKARAARKARRGW